MKNLLTVLAIAVGLALPTAAAAAPAVAILVDGADGDSQALGRLLANDLKKEHVDFQWLDYAAEKRGDPIYKGKLLASLAAAPLVVSVGDEATSLALDELEDTPIYFMGTSLAPGAEMSGTEVSGLFSYSAQDVLAAIPAKWKRSLGLLYSPGYEPVVGRIRTLAKVSGVNLLERKVARPEDIPQAARDLFGHSQAVWVLGDPMLSRGAGFSFLVEGSLAQGVPVIGSGPWEVKHGAVFCSRATNESLAQEASTSIASLVETGKRESRIDSAPNEGTILYHPGMAKRFHLSPMAPAWQALP